METIKNIVLGMCHGLWDSMSGMTLVLHIDNEINKLNAEKEAERKRLVLERQHRQYRRSPSPAPSSAAAMARERTPTDMLLLQQAEEENTDERSLASIRRQARNAEQVQPKGEKKIAKQVLKCCLLNGGFTWLSIILFEQLLLPTLKFVLTLCYGEHTDELHIVWGWLQSILSILFGMMWVLPIFFLSKIVSSLWFADIANAAYRVRKGKPQMIPSISKLVADFLFSLVVQALFLVQSMLVNLLPVRYVGETLCYVHLCLLYSLYCFEYKWFNMGWELHRRLNYIENNWPYFLGFGLPLTFLTNMTSSVIVSSCIFSIFFPLFILSGNEAKPLVGTSETALRLFSPVIFASNLFFNRPKSAASGSASGSGNGGARQHSNKTATKLAQQQMLLRHQQQQQQQQHLMQLRRQERSGSGNRYDAQRIGDYAHEEVRQTHRYQQPPLPPHMATTRHSASHNSGHRGRVSPSPSPSPSPARSTTTTTATATPERGRYSGGMRPLIPTPVAGAPGLAATEPLVRHR